jgi:hypothetical protein
MPDIFTQLSRAIIDLQASEHQTYERPLKILGRLMRSDELTEVNTALKALADFDAFISASRATEGGMAGSAKLVWPDDQVAALGLTVMLIEQFADNPDYAANFCHQFFYSKSIVGGIHGFTRQILIPFARDYKEYILSHGDTAPRLILPGSNKVFIVHGHDDAALHGLARFLEKLGLDAIILKEQPNQGRTIIEKYEACANEVGFAVVLLTPDDLGAAVTAAEQNARARQNVIFELGYFAGKLGRGRVCLLRKGDIEMPSDLFGIIYTEMDPADGWKQRLVGELKAAKLDFDANRMWA